MHLQLRRRLLLGLLPALCAAAAAAGADADEFIYNGFSGADLSMDSQASVTGDGLLRLTYGIDTQGHAFHPSPLNFTNPNSSSSVPSSSFSATFVFAIVSLYNDSSSDGLAFVLSPTKDLLPTSSGSGSDSTEEGRYMGLPDPNSTVVGNRRPNRFLAIELDTMQNSEVQDIDNNHIGIDANSLVSVASTTAGYYTSAGEFHSLSLSSGEPMQVWVDYESNHSRLDVTVAPYYQSCTKPSLPLLSVICDLSSVLPPSSGAYAGFSAATPRLWEAVFTRHCILGWSFKMNGEAATLNYSALSLKAVQELVQQNQPPHHPLPSSSYKTVLRALVVPALVITMGVCAIIMKLLMDAVASSRKAEIEWEKEYGPPSFTYKDLSAATSGFKDKMLLGRGGFGSVFRGVLRHSKQMMVAIKRVSPESKQGMKEFIAEIVILGHLRHRNLVPLIGYCRHKGELLLVYDYMPNGSLDYHLHTTTPGHKNNRIDLQWAQRMHIVRGIASGLFYLHEDWEQVVIHRDIKTSNVLLDSEMNARIGDFGLARSHDHGADAHTTRVAGTWGYIAPELARLGKATKATDVFAFGVLMMEVVCGRRPIWVDKASREPHALADWVLAAWRDGSIADAAVDPRLDGYIEEEVDLVLKLGLLCSHPSPHVRPRMRLVMQYLHGDAPLPAHLQAADTFHTIGVSHDDDELPISLFAAACCGCNPAAAAASTVFFSLWIAAAAIQTAATVSACSQPNTPHTIY
jgi:hypothetical protein